MLLKRGMSFSGVLADRLELPGEALGDVKLSVTGRRQALVENHRGLLTCTEEMISVRTGRGTLSLIGAELRIQAMNQRELLILGRLDRAEWEE